MHPFSPGWRMLSGLVVPAALVASAVIAAAAPFRVDAPGDMRADGRLEWSAFSAAHGTVVPNWTGITAAESELVFTVVGGEPTTMTVTNPGGLPGGGVALASTGPGGVYVFSPQPLQGIGFWIASTAVAGAVTLRALLEEGAEHGLESPVRQPSAAMKEDQ